MGAGILPVAEYDGKLYFLFGQEEYDKKWSDFGGSPSPKSEPIFKTAIREGYEEIDGFFGSKSHLKELVQKNLIAKFHNKDNTYHSYLFKISYDKNLPFYFNNHHKFIKDNFQNHIDNNGYFEKSKMKWFSKAELIEKESYFRHFYKDIISQIIKKF